MMYLIIVMALLAVFRLLFVYFKHKKAKKRNKEVQKVQPSSEENMADYGIEVVTNNNQTVDLSKRNLMLMDTITLIYNQDGSKTFRNPVAGAFAKPSYRYIAGADSKRPVISIKGNTVSWTWVHCRHLSKDNITLLVFC